MKRIRYIILAVLAALEFGYCFGQNTFSGVVTDEKGTPLQYVSIAVTNTSKPAGCTTDKNGSYQFSFTQKGETTIRFSFTGYESQEFIFNLSGNDTKTLNCKLLPKTTSLNEVTVRDERTRSTTFTSVKVEKLEDLVGPNTGVESLVKTLADVSSNNEMSSQYSVRGGSFDENLVYINGIEVYRPFLTRSGQQEGLSIVNPDMVSNILFSPGGFDAKYGDKMSSVLDISYRRPYQFSGSVSASLLGASAHVEGSVKDRFTYNMGFRRHSNRYILQSLDTKGNYNTAYTDFQTILGYDFSKKLSASFLGIYSKNRYGLVPENQTTNFGNFFEALQLRVYFDGQEIDQYQTLLGAVTFDYHPTEKLSLKWITSAYSNEESEVYDIQGQYWLYELNVGSAVGDTAKIDRGIGTYLEHARNFLVTRVLSSEMKGYCKGVLGEWNFGVKYQHEYIDDKIREWKLIDSADYTMPNISDIPGNPDNLPHPPLLQNFVRSANTLNSNRLSAYLQRSFDFHFGKKMLSVLVGIRGQYWDFNDETFVSPRLSVNYKPDWKSDMLFRIAGGVYNQAPFYREYRDLDGRINPDIKSQKSYQIMGTCDWNFRMWNKPFKLTADIYYKYITDLIPYNIDNLRIRYLAHNDAVGYATGASIRINGEFIKDMESWASISVMKTQEDILNDGQGWISRPTDQRLSFKIFFQDYVPSFPWWQMSLNFVYGTGFPFTKPNQRDFTEDHRLPSYFRVDWGNSVHLKKISDWGQSKLLKYFDDVVLSVDVFNLFNYKNVVSYIWIADYDNRFYGVPNYLTARQLNVRLTLSF